ncbi:MAG TPA: hypothetical protein PLT61_00520 [Acinetobacter johnsonii]|nr:hypothetical protein [Acinetobacter johnsonii]
MIWLLTLSMPLLANELMHVNAVTFIETDDSTCVVNDGKLISLQIQDQAQDWVVWVDRWYMNVQTADHTKHTLTTSQPMIDLGCSNTYSGPQHWTIHSIAPVSLAR